MEANGLSTLAQWFLQIKIGAPQCQERDHKIDIPDFLMGLMVWAHKHNGFDKYKLWLPNVRHVATK